MLAVSALSVRADERAAPERQQLVSILEGAAPATVDDLRSMQQHVQAVTRQVAPSTVAIVVGSAQGSGVIVSKDGYVLTAAHVIGKSGRDAMVFLQDGRRAMAKTLGTFKTLDIGVLKLNEPRNGTEPWPYATIGNSSTVVPGAWCLAMGHPGGLQVAREPALRLGRVLSVDAPSAVTTDCTLIGGDSGGPLFNMKGEVVGIHSRIGGALTANLHVPVNTFRDHWDRLKKGDDWGHSPGHEPYLGVQGDSGRTDATVTKVFRDSPADKAGLLPGDLVVTFDDRPVTDFDSLRNFVQDHEAGDKVKLVVQRAGKRIAIQVTIGSVRP